MALKKKNLLYLSLIPLLALLFPSLEPLLGKGLFSGALSLFSHLLILIGIALLALLFPSKRFSWLNSPFLVLYSFYLTLAFLSLGHFLFTHHSVDLIFILDHGFSSLATLKNVLGRFYFFLLLLFLIGAFFLLILLLKSSFKMLRQKKSAQRLSQNKGFLCLLLFLAILLLAGLGTRTGAVAEIISEALQNYQQRENFEAQALFYQSNDFLFQTQAQENIFIIQLESLNGLEFSPQVNLFNKSYSGIFMPVLMNISQQGVLFPLFYANSIQTIRAHENILCGIYSNIRKPYSYRLDELDLRCLPQLLRDNGYQTYYFAGGDVEFANTREFMEHIGFEHVLEKEFLEASLAGKNWAFDDDYVYRKMFKYLENKKNNASNFSQPEKLFIFVSLVGHHYPFENPPRFDSLYHFQPAQNRYEKYLNSLLVQDHHLQIFMEKYAQHYQNNSYLIILGDHPFPVGRHQNFWNEDKAYEDNFLTTLAFIPPSSRKHEFHQKKVSPHKYSQTDLLPTLLSLLSDQYYQNSFSFALKKDHHQYEKHYQDCHVMIQPYDETFFVVNKNNQKYVYSLEKQTLTYFDLNKDPGEKFPLYSKKITFGDFLFKYLCERFKVDFLIKRLFAHRGLSSLYPENTLLAIQKAQEAGFDKIELDITTLQDGTFIVFHDPSFDNKTTGQGQVCQTTKKALFQFQVKGPSGQISDQPVPLLSSVFKRFGPSLTYHLDLKDFGCLPSDFPERLVSLIEKYRLEDHVYVESQKLNYLLDIHAQNPQIRLIYWNEKPSFYLNQTLLEEVKKKGITSLDFYYQNINADRIKKIKDSGLQLHVYTVNDKETIALLLYNQVDFVMTDIDPRITR